MTRDSEQSPEANNISTMGLTPEQVRTNEHESTLACECGFEITVYRGDPYTTLYADCPECGEFLRL